MPQLVKGGKWVYGWVIVGRQAAIRLPPAACKEYRFGPGDPLIILSGSRRSGGFGLAAPAQLADRAGQWLAAGRSLGQTMLNADGRAALPDSLELPPGSRLLAVRGSGRALGFVARGPIYAEASKHEELVRFE